MTRPSTPRRLPASRRIAFLVWIGLSTAGCGARGATAGPEPDGTRRSPAGSAIAALAEAVPDDAEADSGLFVLHRTADRLLFEIPDSLLGRDMDAILERARTGD